MSQDSPLTIFSKTLSFARKRGKAAKLRVRSIDNLDYAEDIQYVEVAHLNNNDYYEGGVKKMDSDDSAINEETSEAASAALHAIKMEREREIFLRAALQLLEQDSRANSTPEPSDVMHSDTLSRHGITTANAPPTRSHRSGSKLNKSLEVSYDVIRYGILRKAGRNNNTFSSLKSSWKSKYVELRFGKFSYEDEHARINWSHDSSNSKRKLITLAVDTCQCRPFRIRSPNGTSVFELTHFGGPRRLWMAGSERERDAWVTAILNAMEGSLDDQLGIGHELRLKVFSKQDDSAMHLPHSNINDDVASVSSKVSDNHTYNDFGDKIQSWDGPSAAFADDIAKFETVLSSVHTATESHSYRNIISRLRSKRITITVPVYYVKAHATDSNFAFSAHDTLNKHNLQSVETSQIWKDLQRDALRINGELIRGESGTEAMVGALMRHIMDRVEIIRLTDEVSPFGLSRTNTNQSLRTKVLSRFDITEAQALACARDILMLCNRTQSGGDSYFCVDALLCDKSKDLCIITPLAAEADPIVVNVDIVRGVDPNSDALSVASDSLKLPGTRPRSLSVFANDLEPSGIAAEGGYRSHSVINDLKARRATYHSSENLHNLELSSPQRPLSVENSPLKTRDRRYSDGQDNRSPGLVDSNRSSTRVDRSVSLGNDPILMLHEKPLLNDLADLDLDEDLSNIPSPSEHIDSGTEALKALDEQHSDATTQPDAGAKEGNRLHAWDVNSVASDLTSDTQLRSLYSLAQQETHRPDDDRDIEVAPSETQSIDGGDLSDEVKSSPRRSFKLSNGSFFKSLNLSKLTPSLTPMARRDSTTETTDTSQSGKMGIAQPSPFKFLRGKASQDSDQPYAQPTTEFLRQLPSTESLFSPMRMMGLSSAPIASRSKEGSDKGNYCIRVEVRVISRYRVCDSNPVDDDSTWAEVSGQFTHSFFIKSGCRGRPVVSDRLVSVSVDKVMVPKTNT